MLLAHNNPDHKQHRYYDEKISGCEIDLKVDKSAHVFQGCEIKDCVILLNCNNAVAQSVLSSNKWINCHFRPKKEMSLPTIEADFVECRFSGKWSLRFDGTVDACDFTEANLIFAAFYKTDRIQENRIKGESTFVIEDLKTNYKKIKEKLSGKTRFGIHIRPEMSMIVFDIEKQKDSNVLRELLSEFDSNTQKGMA
ncbi:hypothetical protein SH580_18410 [Coraliomargarita algicola]|uniref:Pentapeptide repeat-containing protein n=1 Tax=Coraliomargarita algicola TaxID=3092156 RepID=A0ABZ0RGY6_9BACT|nr:hypothetical protein [Coraliomargarita sp. J2-16]WPJ95396.1 hypothetical protein SH580_18410 [Coraliomargarita sp. J2-16]